MQQGSGMEHILINIGSGFLCGLWCIYVGHVLTRQYYARRIAEAIALSKVRNKECRDLLTILKIQVNQLKGRLARYHTLRDEKGRFTRRH